jgi:peptidoglycan/xylan/chitin deacetylase (PgdA/CDA1 family)
MLKTIVKATGAQVLYRTGYLDRAAGRPPLTVLGYHRVLDEPLEKVTSCPLGMVATREMFERQLAYAARRYRMVGLDEIEQAAEGKRALPRRACFVTFDDGWRDNYTHAFPILRRMGIPAAVFVTTDYIGASKVFWFTSLMRTVLRDGGRGLRGGLGREAGWPADVAGELDRLAALPKPIDAWALDELVEMLKRYQETQIDELVAALVERLKGGPAGKEESYFLTWDMCREMDRSGFRVASHTATHKILTQIPDGDAFEELKRSRETLEAQLGHKVVSFAFPNGDYNPSHMTMAWDAGYRCFFVSTRVHPGGPEGRVFPRPCVHDRVGRGVTGGFSASLLELHLAGVLDGVRGRTAY